MRQAMSDVAQQHASGGARYLDLHSLMSQSDRNGVPGRKHFLEHVHFTTDGNQVVAEALARLIWQDVWGQSWSADRSPAAATLRGGEDLSRDRQGAVLSPDRSTLPDGRGSKTSQPLSERLAVQEEDELAARAMTLMIYQKPPFRDAADAPLLAKRIVADSISRFRELPVERQKVFEQLSSSDMSGDLIGELVRRSRTQPLDELHGQWLAAQVIRQPWQAAARAELVQWLRSHSRDTEADHIDAEAQAWPYSG